MDAGYVNLSRGRLSALRRLLAGVIAGVVAAFCLAAAPDVAHSTIPREPAYAPYMGVNTWYGYGAGIDQQTIVDLVNASIQRGLRSVGYRYIWLDAGWWYGQRDSEGNIVLSQSQWPDGMSWLTHYIHARGLLAGIYTDMGQAACRNGGSLGHYQQDINTFAAWGFDAVKGDFCGAYPLHLDPQTYYTRFARDIRRDQPRRPMILYVGNGDTWSKKRALTAMDDWAWAPRVAASWRTWDDLSWPHGITWNTLLRNIHFDAQHPSAAGHGHWNDPDYLAPGKLPADQARAQFTMWIILAAPLMISADVGELARSTVRMFTNREAVAISQDRLGRQGTPVLRRGNLQVWVKPLADGSRAVAVLNRGTAPGSISFRGSTVGLTGRSFQVRNIWARRSFRATGPITFRVNGTSALLLRINPA